MASQLMLFLRRIRRSDQARKPAAGELGAAEIEARRNASFLEGIGAATPDILYAKDRELRYVYVNPAAAAVIGRPIEEILGRRRADFVIHDNVEEEYDVVDRHVLETGRTHTSEE
ncbi:MAG: PAS domain-containing protein, partial [Phenylobacterium sp.]